MKAQPTRKESEEQGRGKRRNWLWIVVVLLVLVSAGMAAVKFDVLSVLSSSTPAEEDTTLPLEPLGAENVSLETLLSEPYSQDSIVDISNFEEGESDVWQGNAMYDDKIFVEGKRSMSMLSTDGEDTSATVEKRIDLSQMKYIEFMIHISESTAYESVVLDLGDVDFADFYRYNLTNLNSGWNLTIIPKEKFDLITTKKDSSFTWSAIEKIRFNISSRPDSILIVRVDMFRSVNNPDDFTSDWKVAKGYETKILSLYRTKDGDFKLAARSQGTGAAVLKDIGNQDNFVFSAAVSPRSPGRTGLFVRGDPTNSYGYYFLIGGEGRNDWQILKKNISGWAPEEEVVKGITENVVFSQDDTYWLRAEAHDAMMWFYISYDGSTYNLLGELEDGEMKSGEVGIAVLDGGWSIFDDFAIKEL